MLYYLYKIIDDKYTFEYNWTEDTWELCFIDSYLCLLSGEEITEEHAIAWTEEIRKQLDSEPYTPRYAIHSKYLFENYPGRK